jgi:hypothetical protein
MGQDSGSAVPAAGPSDRARWSVVLEAAQSQVPGAPPKLWPSYARATGDPSMAVPEGGVRPP